MAGDESASQNEHVEEEVTNDATLDAPHATRLLDTVARIEETPNDQGAISEDPEQRSTSEDGQKESTLDDSRSIQTSLANANEEQGSRESVSHLRANDSPAHTAGTTETIRPMSTEASQQTQDADTDASELKGAHTNIDSQAIPEVQIEYTDDAEALPSRSLEREVETQDASSTKQPTPALNPNVVLPQIESEAHKGPTPHSAITNLYQKQYMGGYLNKVTGARYHHASTQTTRPEELQKMV